MVIDVHGHVTHPELLELLPMPPSLGDIDGMLERKAAAGIDLTVVGSPVGFGTMVPMPDWDNYEQPLERFRSFHEWLAETVAGHSGLEGYAYTNPFGGDELLELTAGFVREGGFVGLMVNTSVRGEYLDSERAAPFFEMATELGVPIFLHPPAEPVGTSSVGDLRLVTHVARFNDVGTCLAKLAFAGTLARYPELDFIAAMGGGAIGLLAERIDIAATERLPGPPGAQPEGPPEQPSSQLAKVYLDTATPSVHTLEVGIDLVGSGRVLFGSDSPPTTTPVEKGLAMVRGLEIAETERDAILGANAARLFGLETS